MKKAFTLLELIVVIVIVGILSLMGVEISLNIYRGYLQSRSINTLEAQTELVLEQISKRLAARIKSSTIGRRDAATFVSTQDPNLNSTYPILEWVSYSYETFQNSGWSGFIDLNHANTTRTNAAGAGTIETPFSNLANASTDIANLTNNLASLNAGNNQVGILFRGTPINIATSFGYNGVNANSIGIVTGRTNNTTLNIVYPTGSQISEQYYLLHTAYAVVPTNAAGEIMQPGTAESDFTLMLHYNYRPWIAGAQNQFNGDNTSRAVLATNVTRFNFSEANGIIILKLCIRDGNRSLGVRNGVNEAEATVCKTKAIY
ncbi:prepilin-type N-terminal cleavage/methylation domain-containing protein [Campylobacter sp. RM16188]|uniref:prepilin-type N-terminal cleavage/methylation domain-containing protein n=1 Tax=Campylobacter sp. RM16188 TaxID=1705725 RepID=UPI0015552D80|nr:prepilin-type N-terminal cleavage/methylation domain-containing protein [Campylobacter sp. RM16188]